MITANIPSSFKPSKVLRASIAAVLGLALTTTSTWASTAGQDAIQAQINSMVTAGIVPVAKGSILKVDAINLNLAVSMAIEADLALVTPLGTEVIAQSALEAIGGKVRGDRNTVAAQVVATAASTDTTLSDAEFGDMVAKVYAVNGGSGSLALTAAGKAAVIAQGIKSATSVGQANAIGNDNDSVAADYSLLVQNVIKSLKTSTYMYGDNLQAYTQGLFDSNKIAAGPASQSFATTTAQKVASSNPPGAGAVMGAYVADQVSGDSNLQNFALSVIADAKLTKAIGEILARTMGDFGDNAALTDTLLDQLVSTGKAANSGIVTQGMLRAGTAGDAAGILAVALPAVQGNITNLTKFAGVVSTRTGGDTAKLENIVSALVSNQGAVNKTTLASSIINAIGTDNPEAAANAIGAVIDSNGGTDFSSDAIRSALAQGVAAKVKAYSAVGYMAGEVVDRNIADSGVNAITHAAQDAVSIMLKNAKAGNDIAYRIGALSSIGTLEANKVTFADAISDLNKKFVPNAAVGVSLAAPRSAGAITAAAITHDFALDKGALSKAAKTAGLVAAQVDVEASADIAQKLALKMSKVPTNARPIKISVAANLAKELAKQVQTKANVGTSNRMDELGEIGAAIAAGILDQFVGDDKGLSSALIAVGSNLIKALNKKELLDTRTQKADLTEARDIVGSIFQTIFTSTLSTTTKTFLMGTIGAPGPLEVAYLKLVGKPGTTHYTEVQTAVDDVFNNLGATKFENGNTLAPGGTGVDYDPITDNVNG